LWLGIDTIGRQLDASGDDGSNEASTEVESVAFFTVLPRISTMEWNCYTVNNAVRLAVHYRDCNDVKLRNIVCISEHLKHDTLAVHVFQKKLISYLRSELIPGIKKI
jgi:hypothetical protein